MFTIVLFIYLNSIFIHKQQFLGAVPRNCIGNHNFSSHLICGRKHVLIWNIRFFSFSIYPVKLTFCKLTWTSRVKSSSSYHTVFSIMRVLRSNFSVHAMAWAYLLLRHPSFIYGFFTLLIWQKFRLFIILLIDERLIPVCSVILRGARCVSRVSSCEKNQFFN